MSASLKIDFARTIVIGNNVQPAFCDPTALRDQGGSGTASLPILVAACGGPLDSIADVGRFGTTKAVDHKEGAMALLEQEATRFAESLDDHEHVSVTDIDDYGPRGFWLVVHDHRFDLDYEIASHCDYWDFIATLVDHKQFVGGAAPTRAVWPTTGGTGILGHGAFWDCFSRT